jgi:soluble cytochrome b562
MISVTRCGCEVTYLDMANAAGTVDDSKTSHPSDRRVLYYAIAGAVLILAGAVAYRIVTTEGNVDVAGGKDGLSVKITQISEAEQTIASANIELKAAQQQLADAQARLADREATLRRVENELKDKEQRMQRLLQQLEPSVGKPNVGELNDARAALQKLQAEPAPARALAPVPQSDALKQRLTKIDELQRSLAKTHQSLKE